MRLHRDSLDMQHVGQLRSTIPAAELQRTHQKQTAIDGFSVPEVSPQASLPNMGLKKSKRNASRCTPRVEMQCHDIGILIVLYEVRLTLCACQNFTVAGQNEMVKMVSICM